MFKTIVCLLLVFFSVSLAPALDWDRNAYVQRHSACYSDSSIRQILALPDEEIDLASALLRISEFMRRSIGGERVDVAVRRSEIDDMAGMLAERIGDERSPVRTVEIINEFIYKDMGYSYDHEFGPASLYLDQTLESRKGVCLTFALLYLCLAERLDLPFYGVIVPGHMFVRYDDDKTRFNIDQGGFNSDVYYRQKFRVPENYDGCYLRNFNKRQVIGAYMGLLGQHIAAAGFFDKGVGMCKQGIKINPDFEESYGILGTVYNNARVYNLSIAEYKRALSINPAQPNAMVGLGVAYANTGNVDHCIKILERAVELVPDYAEAHYFLGRACEEKRWTARAIEEYTAVLRVEPENKHARERLEGLGANMESIAEDIADEQAARDRKVAQAETAEIHKVLGEGMRYYKQGRFSDAARTFEQAYSLAPSHPDVLFCLSRMRLKQGRRSEARKLCIECLEKGGQPDAMLVRTLGIRKTRDGYR